MDDIEEAAASIWHHVGELRSSVVRILCTIMIAVLLCFINYDHLISFLQKPLHPNDSKGGLHTEQLEYQRVVNNDSDAHVFTLPHGATPLLNPSKQITQTASDTFLLSSGDELVYFTSAPSIHHLVLLGPLEGMLVAMKVSLWAGIVVSSPLWLWFLMQFIVPGLRSNERKLALSFLTTSAILIVMGGLFAFFITIPIANTYLSGFNQHIGTNFWSLEKYLDYTLFLILANGAAFELATIGIFAVHLEFLSSEILVEKRRIAILSAFVIATILTPPDVFTQLLLAFPLMGLYEGLILYARWHSRKQKPDYHKSTHDLGM